jgi:hypothetical protein
MIEIYMHPPNKANSHPESCAQHSPIHQKYANSYPESCAPFPPNKNVDSYPKSRAFLIQKKFTPRISIMTSLHQKFCHVPIKDMGYAIKNHAKGHENKKRKKKKQKAKKKRESIHAKGHERCNKNGNTTRGARMADSY